MVELVTPPLSNVPELSTIIVAAGKQETIHDFVSNTVQGATEIIVEDRAELLFIYEQETESTARVENSFRIVLGANAKATIFFLLRGSEHCQVTCEIILQKSGAEVSCKGLYLVNDKRTVECSVHQQHTAEDTRSNVDVRGIVIDEAKVVFNGTIGVSVGANNSNAILQNKNLVLSERARVVSKPCLEVLADAVQCKHGSAIGNVDAEHLFYLQSRGLNESRARNELLRGFLKDVFDSIPDQKIKERWQKKMEGVFEKLK